MKYLPTSLGSPSANLDAQKHAHNSESNSKTGELDDKGAGLFARVSLAPLQQARPSYSSHTATAQASPQARAANPERYRLVAAISLTVLYLGLLISMLNLSWGQPNVGLEAQPSADGRWVVTWVAPAGLSYDQEVRPGDIVVSRDGLSLSQSNIGGSVDLNGSEVLEVQKAGSSELILVEARKGGNEPLARWIFAFLGLIFISVGGPVFVKARQRSAASAFYIFCITTSVALALVIAGFTLPNWGLALIFATLVTWSASFALFFFKFPVRVGKTPRRHRMMVGALLAVGLLVLLAYGWTALGHSRDYVWVQPFFYLYLVSCVTAGLVSLGRSLLTEKAPEVRQQLVLLLGGTALAVGPSVLLAVLPGVFGVHHVSVMATAPALGLMPIAFAYAITQNQLLGVQNFVRRSTVYVIMGFCVLLIFSVGAASLGAIFQGWDRSELGLIGFGLFVFLIALSFGYLQRRVERLVDRYIYHDAYDYKEALLSFSTQLAAEQNLHVLSDQLVERTCRMMNLTCGVLLLVEETVQGMDEYDSRHDSRHDSGHDSYIATGEASTLFSIHHKEWNGADRLPHTYWPSSPQSDLKLVPYTQYGDCAGWMLEGLAQELEAMGVSLHQAANPVQMLQISSNYAYTTTGTLRAVASHSVRAWRSEDRARDNRPSKSGAGTALATTQTVALSTLSALPISAGAEGNGYNANGSAVEVEPIRSFLGVPLWTRSRFVGVLCLGGKKTGERFTKDDISLLTTLGSQAALAIYNAQLYETREQALLDTITALAHAIEAKDTYTLDHCEKITGRAVALAQSLALPRQDVENIRLGSILHDVGKIGIPDAVLNKPSKLTDEEYEIIKGHAQIGARIVQSVGALQGVVPIIRHHQEKYDGTGYPDGLAGEAIPIGARIIAVVDAYGAMTEDRVYRKALGHNEALAELKRFLGKQFDPMVVNAFIRLLNDQPDLAEE